MRKGQQIDLVQQREHQPELRLGTETRQAPNHASVSEVGLVTDGRQDALLELLWIQQAIHSRKQYLRLKKSMSTQENESR